MELTACQAQLVQQVQRALPARAVLRAKMEKLVPKVRLAIRVDRSVQPVTKVPKVLPAPKDLKVLKVPKAPKE
jgi:hypothetical protein